MIALWLGLLLMVLAGLRLLMPGFSIRRLTHRRLGAPDTTDELEVDPEWQPELLLPRPRHGLVWALAAAAVVFLSATGVAVVELAAAFGLLAFTLVRLGFSQYAKSVALGLESELADAIDLVVGGLKAGTSLQDALHQAAQESRGRLRKALAMTAGRLRLGERPTEVFEDLHRALPIDSVRLLGQTLAAQWEAGGSIAPALGSVAMVIRHRVELAGRVRSQSAEVRFSVLAVLAATYGVGLLSWTNAPDRVEAFLSSSMGGGMAAGGVVLQALGLAWIHSLSQVDTL